jgi:tetratricopeptide (TPR) repeat protein
MMVDEVAEQALAALRSDDPVQTRKRLDQLLSLHPDRVDLRHALSVTLLRLGEPALARQHLDAALQRAEEQRDERAMAMMGQLHLARAAACEDTYQPDEAERSYRAVLTHEADHPRALVGLGHMLLAWGRAAEGLDLLRRYIASGGDGPEFVTAEQGYVDAADRFLEANLHPRAFLEAHRGVYVEFFDHHAERLEAEGWIAEAARMHRLDDGSVAPIIPEGARDYAAVRLDLVDPETGKAGQVAEGPMQAAIEGYEPLASGMMLVTWPDEHPFPVYVSSVCPWNWLPVQVRIGYRSEPVEALDPTIGQWYTAGYDGAFGQRTRGRLHFISNPERVEPGAAMYYVDCGRADLDAIDDLLKRLELLHEPYKIEAVLIGRGFLPAITETLPLEVHGG